MLLLLLSQTIVEGDLRVAIAPCVKKSCPIQVQRQGISVDLAVPASPPIAIEKLQKAFGDPLSKKEIDWFSTSSNDETGSPSVLVQTARLGKDTAVVVTMEAGF